MNRKVKIVLIGAGSASFGRGIIADILSCQQLEKLQTTLVLVDVDQTGLELMSMFASRLKDYYHRKISLEATTSRRVALKGADYVITSVAVKRYHFWCQDFYLPLCFGFQHIYGENGGPGAAFHTLRSLHLMLPICQDMEELCPDALLLNFTNPESRVCLGVHRLTRIKAAGLCHGPGTTLQQVAKILGLEEENVEITVAGLNHFHWVVSLRHRETGEDLYPSLRKKVVENPNLLPPLANFAFHTYGLLPFPADSHIGEYFGFAYEICGPRYGLQQLAYPPEKENSRGLSLREQIRKAVSGDETLLRELASPTRENAVSIITGIEFDLGQREISVNLPNENLSISNLPEESIVEVPARVDKDGIHPEKTGSLPEQIACLCRLQIDIQQLLITAYAEKSKKLLLQALLLEPTVDSEKRCREMMAEFFRLQSGYLPDMS